MHINSPSNRRHALLPAWRWLVAGALAVVGSQALADPSYLDQWGPAVGADAPLLAADDQAGDRQTVDTLTGPKGLLLVFSRSVDW